MIRTLITWLLPAVIVLSGVALAQTFPSPTFQNLTVLGTLTGNQSSGTANVLDFGADPTGVADSAPAFNLATTIVSRAGDGFRRRVTIPAGSYRLNGQVNLANGVLEGDGRDNTFLFVDQAFSPAATSVLSLSSNSLDAGPEVRNLSIQFAQPATQATRANFAALGTCTSGSGGTGCLYPPAIAATSNSSRYKVSNVRISRAWDGISSAGVNAVWWLDNIEMSAFDIGLNMAGTFDFSHINGFHFWNFDMQGTDALYTGVYEDGNTRAAVFGEMDGINVRDFSVWQARVQLTSAFSWGQFTNVMMDGDGATFEVAGSQWLQINNIYFTGASNGTTNTHCQLDQAAGSNTVITNFVSSVTGSGKKAICVAAGNLQVLGGRIFLNLGNEQAIAETGGAVSAANMQFSETAGLTFTVPVVQASAGTMHFVGNRFSVAATNAGGLVIATDSSSNTVTSNNFNGWSWAPPAGSAGFYGLNSTGSIGVPLTLDMPATDGTALSLNGNDTADHDQGAQMRFNNSNSALGKKWLRVDSNGTMQVLNNAFGLLWSLGDSGTMTTTGSVILPIKTVATLSTCNSGLTGALSSVTDATGPTYNTAVTGGGAVSIPVFCNGTAWVAH